MSDQEPPYIPSDEQWAVAIEESWAWFSEHLGCTPCSLDVQYWIEGYVPLRAVDRMLQRRAFDELRELDEELGIEP